MTRCITSWPVSTLLSETLSLARENYPYLSSSLVFLSLVVAEALAQMVSHVVPHFVIGMALLAGLYGLFMLVQGFMLVPSNFPDWLYWLYFTGPQTYAWRTFMVSEFRGSETFVGSETFQTGEAVLEFYEIEDVVRGNDMVVLAGYAIVVNLVSFGVLYLRHNYLRGKLEPLDG